MLKYIVTLVIIHFSNAHNNRRVGRYDQIIMSQHPALVKFFKQNDEAWPSADTNYSEYRLGRDISVSLFEQTAWIMHSVWPLRHARHTPAYCNIDNKNPVEYDDRLLDPSIKNELTRKWPTFSRMKSLESHWKTEWDEHGCCMLDVKEIGGVKNYFEKSLNLLDKYNVGIILQEAGIIPGKSYSIFRVQGVLNKYLNATAHTKCLQYMDPSKQYLAEVEICLDKQLNTTNCMHFSSFECDLSKNVFYPIYTILVLIIFILCYK